MTQETSNIYTPGKKIGYTPEVKNILYKSMLASAKLLGEIKKPSVVQQEVWDAIMSKRKDSLKSMLEMDIWTDEDLEPIRKAVE